MGLPRALALSSGDHNSYIYGLESKRAKLAELSGWEGWHILFPLSITAALLSHGHL